MRWLIDTNIVSELRKGQRAHPAVLAWRRKIRTSETCLSVITLMELALGIALKTRKDEPAGLALRGWYEHKLKPSFAGRILPVGEAIAEHGARLQVERSRPGNDVLIAATAVVHDLTLITRNVRDFTGIAELQLVDPWSLSPD